MNIGIVTTWFERGAAYVSKQYASILEKEHAVFIYARGGEYTQGNDTWNQYAVTRGDAHWFERKSKKDEERDLSHFAQWVRGNNLHVVFFNEEHNWRAVKICNELGVKTGAYIDYYTKETLPLFKAYDFLICNTRRHYSVFARHPGAYFIPWGTDTRLFKPKSYDLVESGMVRFFHSAGKNPKRKGTDKVIRAFSALSLKHKNIKLIIHSQVSLTDFFPKLKNTIDLLTARGVLLYEEKTVPAPGLYHLGDVYVYPTILEGIGLTIMEALASGLPVIVSDNAPMNEFINEHNGYLVRIKKFRKRYFDHYYWPECYIDDRCLLRAMEYYIANIHRMKDIKRKARASAEERSWEKNANEILHIFQTAKVLPRSKDFFKEVEKFEQRKRNFMLSILYRIKVLKFDFILVLRDALIRRIGKMM